MFRVVSRLSRQGIPRVASKAVAANATSVLPALNLNGVPALSAIFNRFALPGVSPTMTPRFYSTQVAAKSTIWIGGLPFDTEEVHLRELFKNYGDIVNITMNKRRDGRFIGTAFIEYAEPSEAESALELDGEACGSRFMKVTIAKPKEPKEIKRPENCTSIRFSNVPFNMNEQHIRDMFEHCGEIVSVYFPKDRDTGRLMGYGFVEFVHPESCDKALDVAGADAFGRRINVTYSTRVQQPRHNHKPEGCKSIYVGNLTEEVNSGMLHNLFDQCGDIERVHIALDRETGEPRGFAYVNFAHTDAVDEAIKLSGSEVDGQSIRVAFVRERENRRPAREEHHHESSRGYGRANGERGYGGRGKRGGRDEARFERHHRE